MPITPINGVRHDRQSPSPWLPTTTSICPSISSSRCARHQRDCTTSSASTSASRPWTGPALVLRPVRRARKDPQLPAAAGWTMGTPAPHRPGTRGRQDRRHHRPCQHRGRRAYRFRTLLAARQTSPLWWVCPALFQVIHSESATSDDDEIPSVIRHSGTRDNSVTTSAQSPSSLSARAYSRGHVLTFRVAESDRRPAMCRSDRVHQPVNAVPRGAQTCE